jgi:hypothetical protein
VLHVSVTHLPGTQIPKCLQKTDINPVSPNIEWAMKDTRVNVMQVFNEE